MRYPISPVHSTCAMLAASLAACVLAACNNNGPGAGVRWTSYPALASSTTTYRWLVVKCQISDVPTIPATLDRDIDQFFGIAGAGYGNMVDYFHDVSYNRASVIGETFPGWVMAPFNTADLTLPNARLRTNRGQRVVECLQAIPQADLPDLEGFHGVVVVNNAVQDGGSCGVGKIALTVNKKSYTLACQWFDANSLSTQFAAHEFGHGLGLDDSFDDSQNTCGGEPGRYCDPWDLMSAQNTYQFVDRNFVVAGGGPGMSAPALLKLGWIPPGTQRRFDLEGEEQKYRLRALSRARGSEPLVVVLDVGGAEPFDGLYTIEYRQGDGWDRGFVTSTRANPVVRASGGTVLVHAFRPAGFPASRLINGSFAAALQPCNTLVLVGLGGATFHVTVESFDVADGAANVSIGRGRGRFARCLSDTLTSGVTAATRSHAHLSDTVKP